MSDTNIPGEMDEWDALQAQIDAEGEGKIRTSEFFRLT